jgi:small subunit ribosomal protein S1
MMFDREMDDPQDDGAQKTDDDSDKSYADFLEALRAREAALPVPDVGQRLHAKLVNFGEETSFLDYGGRSEAIMESRHLRDEEGTPTKKIGDTVEAYVIANDEGVVLAPAFTPGPDEALQALREAQRSGVPVTGKVKGVNAGGLDVELAGKRAFCPASQVDLGFCPDASVFVGKTLEFKVIEFAEMGRRIVVSRKVLLQQEKEENAARLRASLAPGVEREGIVARMEPFGAFVDLGGLDGMVHVSEISHDRVNIPTDVLKVGDKVHVRVLEIGKDAKGRDRISLSIKAAQQDPWAQIPEEIAPNAKLAGRIVRLADFGAFVRLAAGIEGLIHVSEMGTGQARHPREVVREEQEVQVRILAVDHEKRRISLSMRDPVEESGQTPRVGMTVEGLIRAHKPYGVFIDLPMFGNRVSGLLPLEETGVRKGGDLSKSFPAGEKIEVTLQQIDEKGRIRLAIPRAAPVATARPASQGPSRGAGSAMAEALRKAMEAQQKASS